MSVARRNRIGWAAGFLVVLLCAAMGILYAFRPDSTPASPKASAAPASGQTASPAAAAPSSAPAPGAPAPPAPGATAPAGPANASPGVQAPDKDMMTASLKRWVERREGRSVEIVDAQSICDINGKPTSLNVLVTTRTGDGLDPVALRAALDANAAREHALRGELAQARRDGDVAAVNRLAGELTAARTAFVEDSGVVSYKLSLSRQQPPVLAFWPGLPFETVREESARDLAAERLGTEAELQGLVHYTSATALMRFAGTDGQTVYVDPFNMAVVPPEALQQREAARPARPDDDGRAERIAEQWAEFLQP